MPSRTYEITFVGQAGTVLQAEFDDCEISVGPSTTTLHLQLADQGALHGLLQRIASFGLELIDVSVVPPADVRDETSGDSGQQNEMMVAGGSLDELGPVDYVVVEFPAGSRSFTGEVAAELRAMAGSGTIRVIDVLILTKAADGTVEATELSDSGELGELRVLAAELGELLAADDVDHLAAAMAAGKHGRGAHLGEPVGGALRIGGAAFGRPADRRRTDSRAGDHRLDRSRRGNATVGD